MKQKYFMPAVFFTVVAGAFSFVGDNYGVLKSDGGPPYNTNAPSEKTCSGTEGTSLCHSGGIPDNSGPGTPSINFSGGGVYVPGQTYTVTISIAHPISNRFGFQIVSLRDNNNLFTGTINLLDTAKTRTQQPTWGPAQDRIFVMHRIAGSYPTTPNLGSWSYEWTAPSTNVGNISFYACFVAANNNNLNDSGDETYWKKITISPSAIGIDAVNPTGFELAVFPNPASEYLNLRFSLEEPGAIEADLLDMNGRVVQALVKTESTALYYNQRVVLTEGLAKGTYLVRSRAGGREYLRKISIL